MANFESDTIVRKLIIVPYVGIANGPGRPNNIRGHLRSLVQDLRARKVHKWYSAHAAYIHHDYSDILLPRYRFGPFKWGLEIKPMYAGENTNGR